MSAVKLCGKAIIKFINTGLLVNNDPDTLAGTEPTVARLDSANKYVNVILL